jgi:hypothetical protein
MKKVICILFSLAGIICCSDDTSIDRKSFEYFEKHLKPDMKYNEFRLIFGEPDEDIGSGIHIYVYNLEDGTKIIIGYTDYIHNARHVDKDFNLLHVLI